MKGDTHIFRFTEYRFAPLILLIPIGQAAEPRLDLDAVLQFLEFTPNEIKRATSGEIVARTIGKQEKHTVAVAGVSRAAADVECFLSRFRDIETFKRSPAVLRIGKLSQPADLNDLQRLTLDAEDLSALRSCRPGECNVRLPPGTFEDLRKFNLSAPDHAALAQSAFRNRLFDYIQRYVAGGNAALIEYRDKSKPLRLREELRSLLDAEPRLSELIPAFHKYLDGNSATDGVEDFLYWSTENFGLKPVTSVTHVIVFRQPGQAVIASKQIYASHYFEASLGITFALDDPGSAGNMYLVYVNRSSIDLLGGFFGGFRRAMLRGRLLDGLTKNVQQVVRQLGDSCAPPDRGSEVRATH